MKNFSDTLTDWYEANKRDLPWRGTKDPYLIWVSEIILQQTRVAQGHDYYRRFVRRFPDVFSLARADEDEVMKYWQGLGYYSRARHLHEAARSMAEAGGFPATYEGVRALKGVGDYTAAAICSFAYDMPCAAVDGNVYRVLSRWLGIGTPIDTAEGKKVFAEAAREMMDRARPSLYNQAIMDFGALVCTPASPDCLSCPLADGCAALQKGLTASLPTKRHKTKVSDRYLNYIYVRKGDRTFIHKRDEDDIWRNLYEPPLIETEREWTEEELYASPRFQGFFPADERPTVRLVRSGVRHVLTHRVIHANFYEVVLPEGSTAFSEYQEVSVEDLYKFAVPRLVNQFFSLILTPDFKKDTENVSKQSHLDRERGQGT